MKKDYYAALGVERSAPVEEIKQAYRRLAKKYHPDVNAGSRQAEERFKEISEAYHVLSDAKRRAEYDRFGKTPFGEQFDWGDFTGKFRNGRVNLDDLFSGRGSGGFGTIDDIFQEMFGQGRGRGAPVWEEMAQPGGAADAESVLPVTFEEAALGAVRTITLQGSGRPETVEVSIPAGVENGARLRLAGKGSGRGRRRGDLYLRLEIALHPLWRREGLDLHLDLPLSLREAVEGATIEIPLPGQRVGLSVPAGSQSGQKLRLRGKGLADARSGRRGDAFVHLQIRLPQALSKKGRELLLELGRAADCNPRAGLPGF